MEVGGQLHGTTDLPPVPIGQVGPRAGLVAVEKRKSFPGRIEPVIQPVARRYTY
jgi:hypothetical protein